MKQSILVVFCVMFLVSCKKLLRDNLSNEKDKYKIVLQNKIDTVYNVKGNTLYIFFETDFNNDLLKININNSINEYYLKTDRSTGYADYYSLNKEMIFKRISFSINNGKVISIDERKSKYNFIYVNYIKDSVVNIQFSNKAKVYR